ncbi:MAG: hypothetical protein H7Y30_01300 [Pyrinomonadaceae bacterium]|nr:hypothetical protein [Pyrinomonadaceae bacterium]
MKTPLPAISILSIYRKPPKTGARLMLPARMAQCTPDTLKALLAIGAELSAAGGNLYLSDLFRSYDMQLQSHLDFKNGKKTAFSPPPGGSLHEAGRACDLDLDALKIKLKDFWVIARKHGMEPIISKPVAGVSESWHFDCRGSHDLVYKYYAAGKGTNFKKPYAAMAASAILAIGVNVDQFSGHQEAAAIQSALIRLGFELGSMDGGIGKKTLGALEKAGVPFTDAKMTLGMLEVKLAEKFPEEFAVAGDMFDVESPKHVID